MRFRPFLVLPLLFSQAGILWSQQTASVTLTVVGVGSGASMGGAYIGPYNVTVNGVPMLLVSDDFLTETYLCFTKPLLQKESANS